MGAKIRMDQIFWKLKKLSQNRRWADGIRVDHLPRIQYVAAQRKWKVFCTDGEKHQKIAQEEFFLCRCAMTFLVEQETMNNNVWQTLDSYLCMLEDLVKDKGHSLVLVPKRSGILWKRTVHKEIGTMSRKRCLWNLPTAHVRLSVQRFHCPEVNSKAQDMENCR